MNRRTRPVTAPPRVQPIVQGSSSNAFRVCVRVRPESDQERNGPFKRVGVWLWSWFSSICRVNTKSALGIYMYTCVCVCVRVYICAYRFVCCTLCLLYMLSNQDYTCAGRSHACVRSQWEWRAKHWASRSTTQKPSRSAEESKVIIVCV